MLSFEFSILDAIQHLRTGFGDVIMPFLSSLGNGGVIWLILAVLFLLIPKYRKAGMALLVALGIEVICCNLILKPLVARIRPCDVNNAVQLLVARPTDFSFPSGHAGASFAAASALFFSRIKFWIPAAVLAALIAFSRLYLYVHYPSDVLAGIMIGIVCGWLGYCLIGLAAAKLPQHKTFR